MKKLLLLFTALFAYTSPFAQILHVDSTRLITGNKCCNFLRYGIPTQDEGILFVGHASRMPGGIIPPFLLDTSFYNVLLVKIDNGRKISWIKVFGGSSYDQAYSVCQTPDGGYAVLGQTQSTDGNVSKLTGGQDIWLIRLDATGNILWEKTYGSLYSNQATSIANTPDHGFIILGTSTGDGNDVPVHYGDNWTNDWIVIKTDSFGNKQWCKNIGGSEDEAQSGSILAIDSSYYLVSGSSSRNHDCVDSAWHSGVNTDNDYYIVKIGAAGDILWSKSYGGSGNDIASKAIYDIRDSTIVVCGGTGSSDYMVTGNHGYEDLWVIKVDRNGKLIWQKTLGSSGHEVGSGVCAGKDGNYLITGIIPTGPIGRQDIWLSLIDFTGNAITDKVIGGTGYEIEPIPIIFSNTYTIIGSSTSVNFSDGTTYGNFNNDGGGFISYLSYWPLGTEVTAKDDEKLRIHPNPAQGMVNVTLPDSYGGMIKIFSANGTIVLEQAITTNTLDINIKITDLPKGAYTVKWVGIDGKTATEKLINR